MKRFFCVFLLISILFSCKKENLKVLLFIKDGSPQLEYMLTNEVGIMSEILKVAGFNVTIATLSGDILKTSSVTMTPDIKLSDVNIDDYAGFIFPCMVVDSVSPEVISFLKKIAEKDKPMAAQVGSVYSLAEAGILNGKKFAFVDEKDDNANMYPVLSGGIFSGNGVVQDGNIITSGTCPWMAKSTEAQDGTPKLTLKLIEVINTK